jgi:hypothetical protein
MTSPRFSIGIDLGTTNSALAFVPLEGETKSEILAIRQWQTLSGMTEDLALPSFLYLPEEAAAIQIKSGPTTEGDWIVGRLARKKAGEAPGRVVHSVSGESRANLLTAAVIMCRDHNVTSGRMDKPPGRGGAASDGTSSCSWTDAPHPIPRQRRRVCLRAGKSSRQQGPAGENRLTPKARPHRTSVPGNMFLAIAGRKRGLWELNLKKVEAAKSTAC